MEKETLAEEKMIGEKIRLRRKELNLTQAQLSELTGFAQQEISRYEKGEYEPSARSIIRFAKALEVSADWLLGLDEDDVV